MRRRRGPICEAQRRTGRDRWRLLSPWQQWLIAQEMPDDLEREEDYYRRTMRALEWRNGDRQWDATLAVLAEGEAEDVDWMTASDREPDGMTLDEIGDALAEEYGDRLGTSRERVRQIIMGAMRKLRELPIVQEMFYGEVPRSLETPTKFCAAEIEAAIARALEAA